MMWLWITTGAMTLLAIAILFLVWKMSRKRMLAGLAERKVRESWMLIERIDDPVRKILEADKVLDLALGLLGFTGTLGEKLKNAGPRFSDINELWNAHKLRNTIAHEVQAHPSEQDVNRAMGAFRRGLMDLGMRQ